MAVEGEIRPGPRTLTPHPSHPDMETDSSLARPALRGASPGQSDMMAFSKELPSLLKWFQFHTSTLTLLSLWSRAKG